MLDIQWLRWNTQSCRLTVHKTYFKIQNEGYRSFSSPHFAAPRKKNQNPSRLGARGPRPPLALPQTARSAGTLTASLSHFSHDLFFELFGTRAGSGSWLFSSLFSKFRFRNPLCNVVFSNRSCLCGEWP